MSTPLKFTLSGLLAALGITGFVLGTASMRAELVVPWAAGYAADEHYLRRAVTYHALNVGLVLVSAVVALVARPAVAAWTRGIGAGLLVLIFIMFPGLASFVALDPIRDARRVTESVAEAIRVSAKRSGHWPTAREVEVSAGVAQLPTPWRLNDVPLLYEVTINKRDVGSFAVPPRPGLIACVTDDAVGEVECRFTPPEPSDPGPDDWKTGVLVATRSLSSKY